MKAPLRFAFGWVLYVAIFMAVAPAVRASIDFVEQWPFAGLVSAALATIVILVISVVVMPRFYRWLDAPRVRP